jgi:hypothetical protein
MNDDELLALNLVHPIHTTERRAFRSCRRRWAWVFRDMYYPLKTARPLEFGVAYHEAMEAWYDPGMWTHPDHAETGRNLAILAFQSRVNQQLKDYKRLNGELDRETKLDYLERVELGVKMIKYYIDKISPQLDVGFKPIGVEVPFEVPLGFRCKCDYCYRKWHAHFLPRLIVKNWPGLPVTYGGRIDMIALDAHDRVWIFDWKTTARILDETSEASFLELDDQITSYVTALWQLGRPVAGFVYHEQRKAVPEPPKALLRHMGGRAFSTAKNANTDYPTFMKTIFDQDQQAFAAGYYDEYLKWLKEEGPRYWQRHQVTRNTTELQNAWDNMVAEAHDIIDNPRIYPQPGRFSCPSCAYRQPCLGKSQGEDYQYLLETTFEKRQRHYFEEAMTTD